MGTSCLSTQVFVEQVQLNLQQIGWHLQPAAVHDSLQSSLHNSPGRQSLRSGALAKACTPSGARCSSGQHFGSARGWQHRPKTVPWHKQTSAVLRFSPRPECLQPCGCC